MSNKKQLIFLIFLVIAPLILVFISRQFFPANYLFSSIYKIIFLTPVFYGLWIEKKKLKAIIGDNFSWANFKKSVLPAVIIGASVAMVYILAFIIFQDFLNIESIAEKLNGVTAISLKNLFFIGFYIIVFNSLLEEFFWRGFMFNKLMAVNKRWLAYILTAIGFSLHHVVFYYNWFNAVIFISVTIGLMLYSVIMSLIFERYKDLYTCWLAHALADVAHIYIAYRVFGLA